MKIHSAIEKGTKILRNNLILNPLLDSEILMTKVINKNREYILLNYDQYISKKDYEYFQRLITKRSHGEPVAYLTSKKFFWNSEFLVDKYTLIPRPDTEIIIENVLKLTKNKKYINILDIGIGSGCILLSILKDRPDFYGTGIDISKNSLNICKINAINLDVNSRLKLFKSCVDKFNLGKYDFIVSNPPYIKKYKFKYL